MQVIEKNGVWPKLPKKFKTKWLKALRSGKYKQTRSSLCEFNEDKNIYSYCCLGVAASICDTKIADYLMNKAKKNELKGYIYSIEKYFKGLGITKKLPKILIGGRYSNNKLPYRLAVMNDGEGNDFNEIADWIEVNL